MAWIIRSPFRLVLVAVSVVLVAVGVGVLLTARGNDSSGVIESYYFEAHIEAHLSPMAGDDNVLDTVRAWYEAPDRWRFEFGDFEAADQKGRSLQVSDGETLWVYDVDTNTYTKQALDTYFLGVPLAYRSPPPLASLSLRIGPLAGGDRDAYLTAITASGTQEGRAGGPVIAGRPTEIVTYATGPAATVKLWIDREYAFVLRYEAGDESVGQSVQAEISDVSFNAPVDARLLTFEPPLAALEVQPSTESRSSGSVGIGAGGTSVDAPPGFLTPGYFPQGYAIQGSSGGSISGVANATFDLHIENPSGDAYLDIDQQYRAGGMAESQRSGLPVAVGDTTGYLRAEGDVTTLVWSQGDIVITLTANQLDEDQLLDLAESMH